MWPGTPLLWIQLMAKRERAEQNYCGGWTCKERDMKKVVVQREILKLDSRYKCIEGKLVQPTPNKIIIIIGNRHTSVLCLNGSEVKV